MEYEKLLKSGDEFYINEEYDKARECFGKALEIKETAECLNYISCCYIKLNKYDEAFTTLKQLTEDVLWERPWFNLGRVYMHYKDDVNAFRCFKKALEIAPKDCDSNYYMGQYYEKHNEYIKALVFYKNSLMFSETNLDKADGHLQIAVCYNALGDFNKAIENLDKAYSLDNKCFDALYDKAVILKNTKKYDAALEIFNFLVERGYDDDVVKANIAQCKNLQSRRI